MRKSILITFILVFSICNIVFANVLKEDCGTITYPNEKETNSRTLFAKYNFTVDRDSNVNLHFISKVDRTVDIEVIETDSENRISALCKSVYINNSPFDANVFLKAGNYTFRVYKIRSSNSVHNTGSFRFSITSNYVEPDIAPIQENKSNIEVKTIEHKKLEKANDKTIINEKNKNDNESNKQFDDLLKILKDIVGIIYMFYPLSGIRMMNVILIAIELIAVLVKYV